MNEQLSTEARVQNLTNIIMQQSIKIAQYMDRAETVQSDPTTDEWRLHLLLQEMADHHRELLRTLLYGLLAELRMSEQVAFRDTLIEALISERETEADLERQLREIK